MSVFIYMFCTTMIYEQNIEISDTIITFIYPVLLINIFTAGSVFCLVLTICLYLDKPDLSRV